MASVAQAVPPDFVELRRAEESLGKFTIELQLLDVRAVRVVTIGPTTEIRPDTPAAGPMV